MTAGDDIARTVRCLQRCRRVADAGDEAMRAHDYFGRPGSTHDAFAISPSISREERRQRARCFRLMPALECAAAIRSRIIAARHAAASEYRAARDARPHRRIARLSRSFCQPQLFAGAMISLASRRAAMRLRQTRYTATATESTSPRTVAAAADDTTPPPASRLKVPICHEKMFRTL